MNVELNQALWRASDKLRGKMNASDSKNYLLGLICYKYLSDKLLQEVVEFAGGSLEDYDSADKQKKLYKDLLSDDSIKEDLVDTLIDTLGYDIEPDYLFNTLANEAKQNSFQLKNVNKAMVNLSSKYNQFKGLFYDVDIQSSKIGLDEKQRNMASTEILKNLNDINVLRYEGDAYEFLISKLASESGKYSEGFYTPHEVSDMMAQIVTLAQERNNSFSVYDPTMGSASMMLNVRNYLFYPDNVKYYGQELNISTYNLARMNFIFHGLNLEDIQVRNGDTLNKDWPTDEACSFDSVIMNPPYSVSWFADDTFSADSRFKRYGKLPPKSKADFAFLLHGFYHLKDTGTMAIILPHGVLFRGAAEGVIRQKLLEDASIYAVIGMPVNIFFGTSIPTTVIILKKNRTSRDVLFIDASSDFVKDKNQNKLTEEHIEKILSTYKERKSVENYSYVASFDEIKKNKYNLKIPLYVDIYGYAKIVNNENYSYLLDLKNSNKYIEAVFIAIKYKNHHKNLEMEKFVTDILNENNLNIELPDSEKVGQISKLRNKLTWARSFLKSNNIIDNKKQGYWTLTKQGEQINSIYFDNKYLIDRFDSIDSFVFESLQVFDDYSQVYDIKFEQKKQRLNNSVIIKSILIGENGAGKSSILRAISQVYLVLSKNQEVDVRINLKDLDYTKYDLKYRIKQDLFYVQLIKEKSNIKIICKRNNHEIPFSHLVFPKKMLAISTIVNDTYMFSSNDYYKYLGTRSSANGSFKGELDKSIIKYFHEIISKDRKGYLIEILSPLDISNLFIKEDQLFVKRDNEDVKFEYLSSGEKNYLNIFMSIISEADASNIILIDEPESSLHPNWQIDFLSELDKLLKSMDIISHVIIATHSHFLISDLKPNNAHIVHCLKNEKNKNITNFIESDTYGWSAENVLYNIFKMRTTRNSYFLKDMDTMINLVENKSEDMEKLSSIISKLDSYTLSKDDPLINIIQVAKDYYDEYKKNK